MTRETGIPKLGDGFVHISNLKYIALSPAHYRVAVERRSKPTPSMHHGSLTHGVLLGGVPIAVWDDTRQKKAYEVFEAILNGAEIAVWEGTRQQKGYKPFAKENEGRLVATREEFDHASECAARADRHGCSGPFLIATQDEYDRALLCAEAVRNDPVAGPLLVGSFERTIEWQYQDRACSSRLDIIGPDGDVADVKTCASAEPIRLIRACESFGYHAQLAFYVRAAASIGITARRTRIIAVESKPPFAVTVLPLTPRTLLAGEKLCRMWMERLLACETDNQWPGYVQSEFPWDLDEERAASLDLADGDDVEAA